ncbi:ADP-glyceromanno-heptose 6-epimerase [Arenicellales bacterium IMCC57338]
MIVVTGGAGFIGSNLIAELNLRGEAEILLVDDLSDASKIRNINDLTVADYLDKDDFIAKLDSEVFAKNLSYVFHLGACSDTMVADGRFVMSVNFEYSKRLLQTLESVGCPLVYASSASVYGLDGPFTESAEDCRPLNAYAYSKALFDHFAWRVKKQRSSQLVGLRYFNVYGPRESHKGRMASVVWHLTHQYFEKKTIGLFEGTDGFLNGEQRRDFVHVTDAVRANLFFYENQDIGGVYNVGTGVSQSFNDVAIAVINACRDLDGESPLSLHEAVKDNLLTYFPMATELNGKYQSFTEADMTKIRSAGFNSEPILVAEGVRDYASSIYQNLKTSEAKMLNQKIKRSVDDLT